MSKFVPRTTAPTKNNAFYYADNIYYQSGWGIPNCCPYSVGRYNELGGHTGYIITGNAGDFFEQAKKGGLPTGQVAKLGAIACFPNHVMNVESIIGSKADCSQSHYNGVSFDFYELDLNNPEYKGQKLQGFIYLPFDFEPEDKELLVRRLYVELLDRSADDSGLRHYVNSGMTESQIKSEIMKSAEYTADANNCHKFWFVVKCYKTILGRYPESDAVVKTRLNMSYQDIFNEIWNSPENRKKNSQPVEAAKPELVKAQPKKGNEYTLNNCNVYSSESGQTIGKRSGKYYVWSNEIKNGRIRMTNAPERCGVGGQVSFWVEVNNLV